jgi:hypothetical protein
MPAMKFSRVKGVTLCKHTGSPDNPLSGREAQKVSPAIKLFETEMDLNDITEQIIGAAIEVHRVMGPGLLESVCEESLCRELALRGLGFERQSALPVEYKGVALDCGYRPS